MGSSYDIVVIGGGLVGGAIAVGCAFGGASVAIADGRDIAHRASRSNNGQVWVQGKGEGFSEYANLTQRSAAAWPRLAEQLGKMTDIDVEFSQPGGVNFCLDQSEMDMRSNIIDRMTRVGTAADARMMTREAIQELVPLALGPKVVGGTYCPHDAHLNPMRMMYALHKALILHGGAYLSNLIIDTIERDGRNFIIRSGASLVKAEKVVICAGLGSDKLAAQVGLAMPVYPYQGQLIITERTHRMPAFLTSAVRQTADGTFQIGTSRKHAGFDTSVQVKTLQGMATRAATCLPALASLSIIRTWSCLRIMTPDGYPIYDESETFPGAFGITCHSGITLAASHAFEVANAVLNGSIRDNYRQFSADRFNV